MLPPSKVTWCWRVVTDRRWALASVGSAFTANPRDEHHRHRLALVRPRGCPELSPLASPCEHSDYTCGKVGLSSVLRVWESVRVW